MDDSLKIVCFWILFTPLIMTMKGNIKIYCKVTNCIKGSSWSHIELPLLMQSVASSNSIYHIMVYWIQHYVIKFVSDLRQVGSFLRLLRFLHNWKWPSRYNWNIVESDVKHHIHYHNSIIMLRKITLFE